MSKKQKKTSFSFIAPEAQSVQLAGDFNSWNSIAHPMERKTDERWEINLNLSPGRYEYKFVVDGQWLIDPNCSDFTSNPFGDENSVLILQ